MSDQSENAMEQPETLTPEEVRQYILAQLDASKQTITELSDEELEEAAGGIVLSGLVGLTALGGYIEYRSYKKRQDNFHVVIRDQVL